MDSLFPTPAADFDHPIDLLDGCHQRIRRQLEMIGRIAAHLAAKGPDGEAQEAARGVIRYFDTAAANHHLDEEDDLFPALHHYAPSQELNAVRALLVRLRSDHRKLDGLWNEMRTRLRVIAGGGASDLTARRAEDFAAAYERHIALEEAQLLPLARRVLDEHALARLGGSMARRRGVRLAQAPAPAARAERVQPGYPTGA